MLFRTHIVIGIFFILLFFGMASNKFIFILFGFIGIVLPDLDTKNSRFGKHFIFRPLQFFVSHRGFIHSITFGVLVSVLLAVIYPIACFGFFVGFSSHIIGDSFTLDGVSPFFPLKKRSYGFINTGDIFEKMLFYSLLLFDTLAIIFLICRS